MLRPLPRLRLSRRRGRGGQAGAPPTMTPRPAPRHLRQLVPGRRGRASATARLLGTCRPRAGWSSRPASNGCWGCAPGPAHAVLACPRLTQSRQSPARAGSRRRADERQADRRRRLARLRHRPAPPRADLTSGARPWPEFRATACTPRRRCGQSGRSSRGSQAEATSSTPGSACGAGLEVDRGAGLGDVGAVGETQDRLEHGRADAVGPPLPGRPRSSPSRRTTVGDIIDGRRRRIVEVKPSGFRSCSPGMLLTWTPGPRDVARASPVRAGHARAHASPSTAVMWVVEPSLSEARKRAAKPSS